MDNNYHPEPILIVHCALNAPMMLVSIIGNILVLAAILRTPSLRSPSTVFLCSLAVSDLLVGLVVQPVHIANALTNDSLHKIRNTVTASACGVSLLTMTAISVDRFLALHYHMRYPNLMNICRASFASLSLWLISFLLSFITFWRLKAFKFAIAVTIVASLVISTVCYIKIYQIVRQHQLQIQAQQQAVESWNAGNSHNMDRSKKNAINTFIYYILMILCYTPMFIFMSISTISHIRWTNTWNLIETVVFLNSSINPFLYCWRLRELRTAVVKTARQMLCRQTDES